MNSASPASYLVAPIASLGSSPPYLSAYLRAHGVDPKGFTDTCLIGFSFLFRQVTIDLEESEIDRDRYRNATESKRKATATESRSATGRALNVELLHLKVELRSEQSQQSVQNLEPRHPQRSLVSGSNGAGFPRSSMSPGRNSAVPTRTKKLFDLRLDA